MAATGKSSTRKSNSPTSLRRAVTSSSATPSPPDRPSGTLIGSRLRSRREDLGISLRQFARDLEVSASFISQLETGKTQPSVATLFTICSALGLSIEELFDDTSPEGSQGSDAATNQWSVFEVTSSALSNSPVMESSPSNSPVVRPAERRRLVLDSGVTWESLIGTRHDHTDFMFVRYEVGGSSTLDDRLIRHS